jgi:hypothetical protein
VSINDWVNNQFFKLNIMLKNILKLNGAQQLSKNDQKEVFGGIEPQRCDCGTLRGCSRYPVEYCNPYIMEKNKQINSSKN